jgi:hypothetical protein
MILREIVSQFLAFLLPKAAKKQLIGLKAKTLFATVPACATRIQLAG